MSDNIIVNGTTTPGGATVPVLRIDAASVNVATIGVSANVARVLPSTANVIQIATSVHVATIQPTQAKVSL